MHFAHIGHDCILEDDVVLTNNATLAGHAYIENGALLMGHSAVHQYCRIGQHSAISPYSGTRQDIPPFGLFVGQPARFASLNRVKLKRLGFSSHTINALKTLYGWFYRDKMPTAELVKRVREQTWATHRAIEQAVTFITSSERGISRSRIKE